METATDWYIICWLWSRRVFRNFSGHFSRAEILSLCCDLEWDHIGHSDSYDLNEFVEDILRGCELFIQRSWLFTGEH